MTSAPPQPRMICYRASRDDQVSPANMEGSVAVGAALAAMSCDDCLILRWARAFTFGNEDYGPGEGVLLLGSPEQGEPIADKVTNLIVGLN